MDARDNLPAAFHFEDFALLAFCDAGDCQAAVGRARLGVGGWTLQGRLGQRALQMRSALTVADDVLV
jgi:hypothetical protein